MSEFDKIIGYDGIKLELTRYANVLKDPAKYAKLGVTIPRGLLFGGAPGIGKTLMANCFIAETGCKAYVLRKDTPNGDFVDRIRETFEAAKNEKSGVTIVFLDDMDKFANEDSQHKNAEEYIAVQACIDDCKGHGVFTLATVNDRYSLPDSLLRPGRFDKVIDVDTPRGKESEAIIDHYLGTKRVMGDVDMHELAKIMEGNTCAEIENVINEAGIYAGYAGREKIGHEDVIKAWMRMTYEIPECIDPADDEFTRNVAVHEAGHAVISEILCPGSVALVSVYRNSDEAKGITKSSKPKGFSFSKEAQEKCIIKTLGGKAATEMVYGVADMGCEYDMSKVFDMVDDFVDAHCTLGFDTYVRIKTAWEIVEQKDRLVAKEVDRYYRMAKRIIAENRSFLDDLTEALMDHKVVTYKEMQEIKKRHVDDGNLPFSQYI